MKNGYERTTIADIAKELSISQGLCYRYFPSREAIYDAVLDAYAASVAEKNLMHRPANQSVSQRISSIPHILASMETAEGEDPQRYALLHAPGSHRMHMELCLRVGEKLLPAVAEVLEQANAAGELHLKDCRQTAVFGIYGEIGLLASGTPEAGKAIQAHWQMLLGMK